MRALIDFVQLDWKEVEGDLRPLWVILRSQIGLVVWLASNYVVI